MVITEYPTQADSSRPARRACWDRYYCAVVDQLKVNVMMGFMTNPSRYPPIRTTLETPVGFGYRLMFLTDSFLQLSAIVLTNKVPTLRKHPFYPFYHADAENRHKNM